MRRDKLPGRACDADVARFLDKVAATPVSKRTDRRARLIFALDATASRQPTWDRACQLQGEMFSETANLGSLDIQLVWYRGFNEMMAGPWVGESAELLNQMSRVQCAGGLTQIGKVLRHTLGETRKYKIHAVVFVGDCVEENPADLYKFAGELGILGVPVFIFHEGGEPDAARILKQIAHLSQGAYCPFDTGSARHLRELLTAVAVYAVGGRRALEDFGRRGGDLVRRLSHQMSEHR